jgi:hypothetical protein
VIRDVHRGQIDTVSGTLQAVGQQFGVDPRFADDDLFALGDIREGHGCAFPMDGRQGELNRISDPNLFSGDLAGDGGILPLLQRWQFRLRFRAASSQKQDSGQAHKANFSTLWKHFFHTMEKSRKWVPFHGKIPRRR